MKMKFISAVFHYFFFIFIYYLHCARMKIVMNAILREK